MIFNHENPRKATETTRGHDTAPPPPGVAGPDCPPRQGRRSNSAENDKPKTGNRSHRRIRRAFSLVEALMALTLTALLAAGAAGLLMETARARTELETVPLLARHARGLGSFLETAARHTLASAGADAGLFSVPPGLPVGTPPMLHLRLDDMTALPVVGETRPAGEVWLAHEPDAGLVAYWRTDREARLDARRVTRTVLSPLVTAWAVLEYDPRLDQWGAFTPGRADLSPEVRRRLVVRLRRYGETAELALPLDPVPPYAPGY